jgi:branched-chain amino acid transport system permease protein
VDAVIQLVEVLLLGLLLGGIYALAASGLSLVFGVMGIINVTQGAFLVLGAYLTWTLWHALGVDPILLTLVTTPVMFGVGWLVHVGVIRRLRNAPPATTVLATFALALVVVGLLGMVFSNDFRSVTPPYYDQAFHFGQLYVPAARLYGCGVAVVLLAGLWVLLSRTWLGRAIRASAENPDVARLAGIEVSVIATLTFAIGTATTGAGGSLISILYPFFPATAYVWISRLLGIVVLGGMSSLRGAFVGALLMGVAEMVVATYVSTSWTNAVPYLVILVVLLLRPDGIFGRRTRTDVAVARR